MTVHPADVLDVLDTALHIMERDEAVTADAYETHDAGEPEAAEQAASSRERERLARAIRHALTAGDPQARARALAAIMDAIGADHGGDR